MLNSGQSKPSAKSLLFVFCCFFLEDVDVLTKKNETAPDEYPCAKGPSSIKFYFTPYKIKTLHPIPRARKAKP